MRSVRVFIVDDSAFIRARLITMLHNHKGVEIIGQSESAITAPESIRLLKPDVVILDIGLKGGSGIDVLQTIKEFSPSPVTIMLTNYSQPKFRDWVKNAGGDFFFDKSTEFDKAIDVINEMTSALTLIEQ